MHWCFCQTLWFGFETRCWGKVVPTGVVTLGRLQTGPAGIQGVVYFLESALKLIVHRAYFFWNEEIWTLARWELSKTLEDFPTRVFSRQRTKGSLHPYLQHWRFSRNRPGISSTFSWWFWRFMIRWSTFSGTLVEVFLDMGNMPEPKRVLQEVNTATVLAAVTYWCFQVRFSRSNETYEWWQTVFLCLCAEWSLLRQAEDIDGYNANMNFMRHKGGVRAYFF